MSSPAVGYPPTGSLETPGNRSRSVSRGSASKTSHACTAGTLLEHPGQGNKNLHPGCAEPVEDSTSLWKHKENRAGKLARGFAGNPSSNHSTRCRKNVNPEPQARLGSVPHSVHKSPQFP